MVQLPATLKASAQSRGLPRITAPVKLSAFDRAFLGAQAYIPPPNPTDIARRMVAAGRAAEARAVEVRAASASPPVQQPTNEGPAMTARLRALGVPQSYLSHAAHFEQAFKNLGWTQSQIDHAVKWGVAYQGAPDQAGEAFEYFASNSLGVSSDDAFNSTNVALSLRDTINTDGVESLPAIYRPRITMADSERMEEIRRIRREDPDLYNNDQSLQLEELGLIEASRAAPGAGGGGPRPAINPQTSRLEEIRQMVRSDPDALTRNPGLEAEQISLISGTMPEAPQAVASADAGSSTSEGNS
jgi:hypothetical protein